MKDITKIYCMLLVRQSSEMGKINPEWEENSGQWLPLGRLEERLDLEGM